MKPLPFNPENWSSEFEVWEKRLGGIPAQLLASHDKSDSYDMDRGHVFKIRPGRYALVTEYGTSMYDYEEARIFIYGDERSAMSDYFRWKDEDFNFEATGTEVEPERCGLCGKTRKWHRNGQRRAGALGNDTVTGLGTCRGEFLLKEGP